MAEGFVIPKSGVDLSITARGYLAELADRGIITPIAIGSGDEITKFQVPLVIQGMLDCISSEHKFFTKLPFDGNSVKAIRANRVSVLCQRNVEEDKNVSFTDTRSLLVISSAVLPTMDKMKYLRVLIIINCDKCDNMRFLGKLSFLKVLVIRDTTCTYY
uniref:Uncharacterized protein n=1 Tax=Arundo donax TaxID=35708 RepID=A0A0A9DG54_ARUDO